MKVSVVTFCLVASMLLLGAVAQNEYQDVQYNDAPSEERFREEGHMVHPTVSTPEHSIVPVPSVPEPEAAQEPRKSLVEEVTGESVDSAAPATVDASAFRFRAAAEAGYSVATDSDNDPEKQLIDALQNVKDQIVAKASQIKQEKKWVKEVTKIIETYVQKTRRVNADIRKLQKEVKDLFRKKKQIENIQLQRKLKEKLKIANKDLHTLETALNNVKKKETAFTQSKAEITETIAAVQGELQKLKGAGGSSASASS